MTRHLPSTICCARGRRQRSAVGGASPRPGRTAPSAIGLLLVDEPWLRARPGLSTRSARLHALTDPNRDWRDLLRSDPVAIAASLTTDCFGETSARRPCARLAPTPPT
jgi:hypothetical protein